MLTHILTLPEQGRDDAVAALEAWHARWRGSISDRFILDAREVMVICEAPAIADLPDVIVHREHPRDTRWALAAEVREPGTRRFEPGAFVIVYPPSDDAPLEKVRVLGPRRGALDFAIVTMPTRLLDRFRVAKVGHPALLCLLEREPRYYDVSTAAQLRASDAATALQAITDAAQHEKTADD